MRLYAPFIIKLFIIIIIIINNYYLFIYLFISYCDLFFTKEVVIILLANRNKKINPAINGCLIQFTS